MRADARKREWFACNGVAVQAPSRAPLNAKDRYTLLSPRLLTELRRYWLVVSARASGCYGATHAA